MRISVISDTHVPKVAPRLDAGLLERLEGSDLILHAGDLVELAVLDELKDIAPTVAVYGNMDQPEVTGLLPEDTVVEAEGVRIGLVHGWGPPMGIERRVLSRFSGVDAVIFGHTHKALLERRKGVLLLNPGTPMDRRFSKRLSYAVLDVGEGGIEPEIIWLD